METRTIKVLTGKSWENHGYRFETVRVMGQLGVYQNRMHPASWVVCDLDSGAWIAEYSAEHIAEQFARRIEPLLDWTGLARRFLDNTASEQECHTFIHVMQMREHECYIPNPNEIISEYAQRRK